jgi:hypothetical protein
MGCDYYSQSKIIIEYRDEHNVIHKTTLYISDLEKHYMGSYDYDSDDDYATKSAKYELALEKDIKNTVRGSVLKILYLLITTCFATLEIILLILFFCSNSVDPDIELYTICK